MAKITSGKKELETKLAYAKAELASIRQTTISDFKPVYGGIHIMVHSPEVRAREVRKAERKVTYLETLIKELPL